VKKNKRGQGRLVKKRKLINEHVRDKSFVNETQNCVTGSGINVRILIS
jgi:hypothetical protein